MMDALLEAAGFAMSLGGLWPWLRRTGRGRSLGLLIVSTTLLVLSGRALYQRWDEKRDQDQMVLAIVNVVGGNLLTLEDIDEGLHFAPFDRINEALFVAVERGLLNHKVVPTTNPAGEYVSVRYYFRPGPTATGGS